MQIDFTEMITLSDPCSAVLKADAYQFLLSLTGPTIVDITGKDTSKTLVFVTLLNGNEPTGLLAIHQWLTERDTNTKPATNVRIIVCSIEAATSSPMLKQSHVQDAIPLTQCFGVPFNHGFFKRAKAIEDAIRTVNPSAVISLHNTYGFSPAFACAAAVNNDSVAIAQSFVDTIILSEQMPDRLLTLSFNCPNIAIYVGSAEDPQSNEVAINGIEQLTQEHPVRPNTASASVLLHPKRLLLSPGSCISFCDKDLGHVGITLREDIEQFNFRAIKAGQHLGWLDEKGLSNVILLDHLNNDCTTRFFTTRFNQFVTATDMTLFMATNFHKSGKPESEEQEYLFYVIQN